MELEYLVCLVLGAFCTLSLTVVAAWWYFWGKEAHYRRVIAWSDAADYQHHEYKAAIEYFKRRGG